jgi:hypothetical protein
MALATSKRKFYKLLDNLSTTKELQPTPNVTEKGSVPPRPIKRTRMATTSSSTARPFPATATPSRTSVRVISSNYESSGGVTTRVSTGSGSKLQSSKYPTSYLPAYSPWSQEQFLQRLKTFADVKTWSLKPEAIGEVVWAKRGWSVVGKDEVSCEACRKRVIVRVETKKPEPGAQDEDGDAEESGKWWSEDTERRLVLRYEELVVSGHSESCLWSKAGCKGKLGCHCFSSVSC